MSYQLKAFVTGPIETNTFVVSNDAYKCVIIDPANGCREVLEYCKKNKLTAEAIVLTHAHFDHIMGIPEIQKVFPAAPVFVHQDDLPYLQQPFNNASEMFGDSFEYSGVMHELAQGTQTIGSFTFQVLHLPGHTPGGCAFYFDNICISGDVLFASSIGRTDFPGGDEEALLNGIRTKLLKLPDNTIVYPGHGNRTTIGREKQSNPFIQ
jgi:hydroxyacylglutathione hydrolase